MVNNMKLIATLLLIFTVGSFSSINAQQQNRSSVQPGLQHFIIQYGEALELTDQQKTELLSLRAERRSVMQNDSQKGRMTQQNRSRMNQQQRSVRGQQRGMMRSDSDQNRPDRPDRAELRMEQRDAIMEILTDEQETKLHEIRVENIENRSELLLLRNRTLVEKSVSDSEKAEEVIVLLNRITDIQKETQLQQLENAGEINDEKRLENVTEIRSIHDQLMNKITVAEYRALRPALATGQQRQRSDGRGMPRNR
jgi:hypothetical protein